MIGPTRLNVYRIRPYALPRFNFYKVLPDGTDFALRLLLEKYVSSQRLYYQIPEFSRQKRNGAEEGGAGGRQTDEWTETLFYKLKFMS